MDIYVFIKTLILLCLTSGHVTFVRVCSYQRKTVIALRSFHENGRFTFNFHENGRLTSSKLNAGRRPNMTNTSFFYLVERKSKGLADFIKNFYCNTLIYRVTQNRILVSSVGEFPSM